MPKSAKIFLFNTRLILPLNEKVLISMMNQFSYFSRYNLKKFIFILKIIFVSFEFRKTE